MECHPTGVHIPDFFHIKTGDPDEIYDHVNTWEQEYTQLKKGQFAWEVGAINIGEFQFARETFNISTFVRGQIPKGCVAIALPKDIKGDDSYLGHDITSQTLLKAHHVDSFDIKIGQKLEIAIMVAPVNQVLLFAEKSQCPISEDLLAPGIIICDAVAQHYLSHYLDELFFLLKNQPEQLVDPIIGSSMAQLILSDALPLFVDVITSKPLIELPQQDSNYRQLVKFAETFIQDRINQPITLQDLCEHLHASQRSLNYAFKTVYGLAPMKYLKVLRLNQVRYALRSADPSASRVTDIASRFGFWHMSQFSADYRRMFGESPSKTLKRK
jgi:AraC family ethanolamine operon transcriptional activator